MGDLARSLNTAAPRTPNTLSVPAYLLRFHLLDGELQEIGAPCDGTGPTFSGDQGFWLNQEATAPHLFVALLYSHL